MTNVHYPKSDFKPFSIEQSFSKTGQGIASNFSFDIDINFDIEANIMALLFDICKK